MPVAMHWIALQWPAEGEPAELHQARSWWALRFTPRVAWVGPALLLEVSGSMRLWGGRRALLERLLQTGPGAAPVQHAEGATSLVALARLRLRQQGRSPSEVAALAVANLPWRVLDAARPHAAVLQRLGLRNWGDLDALPRSALARRFGVGLLHALDVAFGRAPDRYRWQALPQRFRRTLQLPQRADSAPALLWTARRLLGLLQQWLVARQQGVLALELAWQFDQLRAGGRALPPWQATDVRTAQPVQAMVHLERLLAEQLARVQLLAPASSLRLRVLETAPWLPPTSSLLPEEASEGEPWHRFVERAHARLGAGCAVAPVLDAVYGPEARQHWVPALPALPQPAPVAQVDVDMLAPLWLLQAPERLRQQDGEPCFRGQRLRLLAGPDRMETGWWTSLQPKAHQPPAPVARDYFVAQCADGPLLWVYRERLTAAGQATAAAPRWFVQGVYA
ncbi:MAG: DNA polymerase Y family protein [Ottowia sp.]|nr:DNA polymerase Y family protein [Ottowia sp.]